MIRPIKTFFILLSILIITSCTQEPPVLQQKTEFNNSEWNRFKYLEYKPEITDNSSAYIFNFKLEVTEEYPYNFLKIQLSKESGGESYVKIFTIPIKDQQGNFIEKPKDGIYTINAILSRQIYFSAAGTYLITIEELMPPYYLKGVKSAEFTIEKRIK